MVGTPQTDFLEERRENLAESISDRLSQELVVALVGPVASGVSTAAKYIEEILIQQFGYEVAPIIKPSDIIRAEMHRVGIADRERTPLSGYIGLMQSAGNKLREKFGPNYLAEKTVERIVKIRQERGGYRQVNGNLVPMPGRRAYIIDSIKNVEELELLRQIYGETLCLVGVFAPDAVRRKRLIDNGAEEADVQKILDRDQGEVMTFGQMTRKVFVEADFFICNDQKKEELGRGIERYLQIIFDTGIHTPTRAETAMYKADAVSSNSACMSRRVGAAIVAKSGELVALGWNDVPKFGGALYVEDDQSTWDEGKQALVDRDNRCFKWGQRICHNEVRRNAILDGIAARIAKSGLLKKGANEAKVRALLAGTEVDSLTESGAAAPCNFPVARFDTERYQNGDPSDESRASFTNEISGVRLCRSQADISNGVESQAFQYRPAVARRGTDPRRRSQPRHQCRYGRAHLLSLYRRPR